MKNNKSNEDSNMLEPSPTNKSVVKSVRYVNVVGDSNDFIENKLKNRESKKSLRNSPKKNDNKAHDRSQSYNQEASNNSGLLNSKRHISKNIEVSSNKSLYQKQPTEKEIPVPMSESMKKKKLSKFYEMLAGIATSFSKTEEPNRKLFNFLVKCNSGKTGSENVSLLEVDEMWKILLNSPLNRFNFLHMFSDELSDSQSRKTILKNFIPIKVENGDYLIKREQSYAGFYLFVEGKVMGKQTYTEFPETSEESETEEEVASQDNNDENALVDGLSPGSLFFNSNRF